MCSFPTITFESFDPVSRSLISPRHWYISKVEETIPKNVTHKSSFMFLRQIFWICTVWDSFNDDQLLCHNTIQFFQDIFIYFLMMYDICEDSNFIFLVWNIYTTIITFQKHYGHIYIWRTKITHISTFDIKIQFIFQSLCKL